MTRPRKKNIIAGATVHVPIIEFNSEGTRTRKTGACGPWDFAERDPTIYLWFFCMWVVSLEIAGAVSER